MSAEREVKLLSLVDVLEPLSEEELEEVSTRCPSFSLDAGQDFFGSSEHDGGLFLIEEGHVVIYKMTSSGKQITFAVHSAGTVLPALRTSRPDRPSHRALCPCLHEARKS